MAKPDRTVGLTIHLLYPLLSCVLLAIAAFASGDSVWYASANTQTLTVGLSWPIRTFAHTRFGSGPLICEARAAPYPFPPPPLSGSLPLWIQRREGGSNLPSLSMQGGKGVEEGVGGKGRNIQRPTRINRLTPAAGTT